MIKVVKYKVEYNNGFVQIRDLINQEDYESIYLVKQKEIAILLNNKQEKEANKIKSHLKQTFGDNFFTTNSPLFKAKDNGELKIYGNQIMKVLITQLQ